MSSHPAQRRRSWLLATTLFAGLFIVQTFHHAAVVAEAATKSATAGTNDPGSIAAAVATALTDEAATFVNWEGGFTYGGAIVADGVYTAAELIAQDHPAIASKVVSVVDWQVTHPNPSPAHPTPWSRISPNMEGTEHRANVRSRPRSTLQFMLTRGLMMTS